MPFRGVPPESHCMVVFKELLSSLAHSLKLRGLLGLEAALHRHSLLLDCDVMKPVILGTNSTYFQLL